MRAGGGPSVPAESRPSAVPCASHGRGQPADRQPPHDHTGEDPGEATVRLTCGDRLVVARRVLVTLAVPSP